MQSFEQPSVDNGKLLKTLEEKTSNGWKRETSQLHKTFLVAVYIDTQMLYADYWSLFKSLLIMSLTNDFLVDQGYSVQKLIILPGFSGEELDIAVSKELVKIDASEIPDSPSLNQIRNEKIKVLLEKVETYGLTPNITEIRLDTELCSYQKMLEASYFWLRESGGSVINDTPCIRLKDDRLIPLMRYGSVMYRAANNIAWMQEFCKRTDAVLIISSSDNLIGKIGPVIRSKFDNLFYVSVQSISNTQYVNPRLPGKQKIRSKHSIDPCLHLLSLLQELRPTAYYLAEDADDVLNQISRLMDVAKKWIGEFHAESQGEPTPMISASVEVTFAEIALDYESVIQEFINSYRINIVTEYLLRFLDSYQTLILDYGKGPVPLKRDVRAYIFSLAFRQIVSNLLSILGLLAG